MGARAPSAISDDRGTGAQPTRRAKRSMGGANEAGTSRP
jgi:hypothetical protein